MCSHSRRCWSFPDLRLPVGAKCLAPLSRSKEAALAARIHQPAPPRNCRLFPCTGVQGQVDVTVATLEQSRGERQPLAACVHCARVQTRICWRLPRTDLHLTPFTPPYAARGKPLQSFKGYRQCAGGNLSKRSGQSSHSLLEQPPEPLSCHGC